MDIREVLLSVIEEKIPRRPTDATLQTGSVLNEAGRRLNARNDPNIEEALLTQWHELFRTGYLAWGFNLANPNPPFCHLTAQGREALAQLSRDPANPEGYLRHLYSVANLNPISKSYIEEALGCYVVGMYKAGAVMVGAASESIVIELRDSVVDKLNSYGRTASRDLSNWKVRNILKGLRALFENEKSNFNETLRDEYEAFWSAFTQQIRAARNDAGHPSSVDPITPETIHGSLLIFPELAKLANGLENWVSNKLT